MDINYVLIILVILLAICLVIFLIVKNRKDRKTFEKLSNQSHLPAEQHADDSEKL